LRFSRRWQVCWALTAALHGFFGGTSLIILVGVVLDTLQQIESHLLMRHYDGLMKTGRIKGRTGMAPGGAGAPVI